MVVAALRITKNFLTFNFSKYAIPFKQTFLVKNDVFAFVNNRPAVQGHVLISPIKQVKSIFNLSEK